MNQALKKLLKYSSYVLITVGLIYVLVAIILVYIGPFTTLLVKHRLKNKPVDIIVSLTTTPYRIDTIKPVLDGIFKQSIKPTRVYVNVPYIFKRENREYVIPEWLKSYPNIIINRTKDYGPGTKLIATLEKEDEPNTVIITFDDDKIYPKHVVRDLVNQYLSDPSSNNKAITGLGLGALFLQDFDVSRPHPYFYYIDFDNSLLVVGATAVLYKRNFFGKDIFSLLDNVSNGCFLSDDLMISAYLIANNIDIVPASGVSYKLMFDDLRVPLLTSLTDDSLEYGTKTAGNRANYSLCVGSLPKDNRYKISLLSKSRFVFDTFQSEWFSVAMSRLYYRYYLTGFINIMPFVKKIYIKVMG